MMMMMMLLIAAAVDVDECTLSSPCSISQICLNSYGSYVCLRRSAAVAAGKVCRALLMG